MQGELLGGGTVFALDHRIPNGVPIENYRAYVRMGPGIARVTARAACRSRSHGILKIGGAKRPERLGRCDSENRTVHPWRTIARGELIVLALI